MKNVQKERLQAIGHHTMNLYQIEMTTVKQESQLIAEPLKELPAVRIKQVITKVHVMDENILFRIKETVGEKEKVGLLNFASPTSPGGNFLEGINAQEQTICRNSFLYPELLKYRRSYYLENRQKPREYYYNAKMIFAKHIKIIHDETELKLIKGEKYLDILSLAAPNVSAMKKNGMVIDWNRVHDDLTQKIIQTIRQFKLAGDRILILGAFGCGAFGNDPVMVATIFKEVLGRPEFIGSFIDIYFDILANPVSLAAFEEVFR
ncbi:TIGR02452 family protein [Liquorilactobacillus capillatus]|uniref:TIGR02452 family protein n=1 Tax=Liquorilactobacillus capillatus TaxID=480931 RepID=UPI000B31B2C2|nr:TIGR02452 family protein [Liquorilactobacillus capillatus]